MRRRREPKGRRCQRATSRWSSCCGPKATREQDAGPRAMGRVGAADSWEPVRLLSDDQQRLASGLARGKQRVR
eukprot:5743082-Prymnesium_polylepis.1